MTVLAVPLLVLRLTDDPAVAALALGTPRDRIFDRRSASGPLVDRVGPWRILIASDVVRLLVFLVLFGSLVFRPCSVGVIVVLACVAGVAGAFFETALVVAVRDSFTGADPLRANGLLELVGQLTGPDQHTASFNTAPHTRRPNS
ncbi:hypothetical protein ACLMAL_13150 [Nocardia sp. CWNU-33]|uniref:hypothetical protein n=1 Tax=Nocardia sp. CWNU-33 TaxID=3392117 RepID=UPI00398E5038